MSTASTIWHTNVGWISFCPLRNSINDMWQRQISKQQHQDACRRWPDLSLLSRNFVEFYTLLFLSSCNPHLRLFCMHVPASVGCLIWYSQHTISLFTLRKHRSPWEWCFLSVNRRGLYNLFTIVLHIEVYLFFQCNFLYPPTSKKPMEEPQFLYSFGHV